MINPPYGSVRRGGTGRIRPSVDRLDHRTLLSGATVLIAAIVARDSALSIETTSPASSTVLAVSPSSITVTFDKALEPFSVGTSDFELEHLASDGSTNPLGPDEAGLSEKLDPSGIRITLTPTAPLAPGNYRVVLSAIQGLRGVDGSALTTSKVEDFQVGTAELGLAGATDLGVPTSSVSSVPGSLYLLVNPDAVNLSKIEIPVGQFDRLGLEVASTRIGGTLHANLSLFDASGKLITTSSAGRPDFPFDPYLFAGIGPGTYYIGVSGAGNVPGLRGGYDPSSGLAGVTGRSQFGGDYQLHLVADPVSQAAQVLGIQVDHADPNSTAPTGLTVQFSAQIQTSGLGDPSQVALELVDSQGQAWPLTATAYDDSTARLSLAFDQPLPAGSYGLELAGQKSLVDLAGLVPVAQGDPANVLGTVGLTGGSDAVGDLGALFPGIVSTGQVDSVSVPSGLSVSEQVTVVEGGTYAFKGLDDQVVLDVSSVGSGPNANLPMPATRQLGEQDLSLVPGTYRVTFTNQGTSTVDQAFRIQRKATQFESFLESGVAQGPALNLRLISPRAFASVNSAETGIDPQPASAANLNPSTPTGESGQAAGPGSTTFAPTVLNTSIPGFVSVGTPFGRPTLQSQYISIVGPPGNASGASMSLNDDALPGWARPIPVSISLGPLPKLVEAYPEPLAAARVAPVTEAGTALAERPRKYGKEFVIDELILTEATWLEQIVGWTMAKYEPDLEIEVARVSEHGGRPDSGRSTQVEARTDSRMEVASMASPVGFGIAVLVALRYRNRRSSGGGNIRRPPIWPLSREPFRGPRALRGQPR